MAAPIKEALQEGYELICEKIQVYPNLDNTEIRPDEFIRINGRQAFYENESWFVFREWKSPKLIDKKQE